MKTSPFEEMVIRLKGVGLNNEESLFINNLDRHLDYNNILDEISFGQLTYLADLYVRNSTVKS